MTSHLRYCLYPGCDNTPRTRGLCHLHYQAARSYVRARKVTEAQPMEHGLMTKKGEGGSSVEHHHLLLCKR